MRQSWELQVSPPTLNLLTYWSGSNKLSPKNVQVFDRLRENVLFQCTLSHQKTTADFRISSLLLNFLENSWEIMLPCKIINSFLKCCKGTMRGKSWYSKSVSVWQGSDVPRVGEAVHPEALFLRKPEDKNLSPQNHICKFWVMNTAFASSNLHIRYPKWNKP